MGLMKETFSALVGDEAEQRANLSSRLLSSTIEEAAGIVRSRKLDFFKKKESLIIALKWTEK